MEEIKKLVLEQHQKGNVVIQTIQGLEYIPMASFVRQHANGILYDLNKTIAGALSEKPDRNWVNDFAAAQTIIYLKDKVDSLENTLRNCIEGSAKFVERHVEKLAKKMEWFINVLEPFKVDFKVIGMCYKNKSWFFIVLNNKFNFVHVDVDLCTHSDNSNCLFKESENPEKDYKKRLEKHIESVIAYIKDDINY